MNRKPVSASRATTTELVLPNDTNPLNGLMGGRMMHLMDVVAAIAAQRHAGTAVVTASVDNVSFASPIALGEVVTLTAQVTRAFRTSMEVHIDVYAENIPQQKRRKSNEAFLTFVSVGKDLQPQEIPEAIPETPEERELYDGALRRRQLRLILAGRLAPTDATELRSIFDIQKDQPPAS